MIVKDLKAILSVVPDDTDITIEIWRNRKLDTRSHVEEVIVSGYMDLVTIVGEFKDKAGVE